MNNDYAPVVSVVVLSYNFRNYLKDCLDSVLAQKTDTPFEIIVADDASTDGSDELIREYQRVDPRKIKPIIQPKNIGAKRNLAAALQRARGKYIAYIDGDDLMADCKLSKQVEFLEAHPECVLVAHLVNRMLELKGGHLESGGVFPVQKRQTNIEGLCHFGNFIHSGSVMYRKCAVPEKGFPIYPWARAYDYCRTMILAQSGDIGLIHQTLGTYRVHSAGTSTAGQSDIWRIYYGQRRALQVAKYAGCPEDVYQNGLARLCLKVALRYLGAGDYAKFKKMIRRSRKASKLPGLRQWGGYHFRYFAPLLRSLRPIKNWLR